MSRLTSPSELRKIRADLRPLLRFVKHALGISPSAANTEKARPFLSRFSPLALGLALLAATRSQGARIYFTDQPADAAGSVISVALDGSAQTNLLTIAGAPDVRGIAFHHASGRIYFLDNGTAKRIYSLLPDGSGLQEVLPVSPTLLDSDVEIDEAAGKLYWAENNPTSTGNGFIQRANLDGSGVEPVVTTAPGTTTAPYFIFLDPPAGYVYWGVVSSGNGPSSYRRATLTGVVDTNFLITTPTRTRDLAIDPTADTMYWCDRQLGMILKRALSGGAIGLVITNLNAPHGLALDLEAGKVYWADTGARGSGPFNTSARRIARCNFDGTEYENLSSPAANSEPWDLALDTRSPTYDDWRTRFFSTNSPAAAALDDADNDGAPNLLEYALGSQPRRAASVPRIVAEGTGMRFSRRTGANLTYRAEVSTDLTTWHYNGDPSGLVWTVEATVTPLNSEFDSVLVSVGPALAEAMQVFYRLYVSKPLIPEN